MIGTMKEIKMEWWKTVKDGSGNNTESVYKRISMWADVKRVGGGRTNSNGITSLENTIEFKVHFKPNVFPTGNFRVVYDGRRHTVQSVVKDKEKRFSWVIIAKSADKK